MFAVYGWLIVIACVIIEIAIGCMCSDLAQDKGYSTRAAFWCGIFLCLPALIYYAGRPVSEEKRTEIDRARCEMLASVLEARGQKPDGGHTADAQPLKNKTLAAMDALERASEGVAHRIPIEEIVHGSAQCLCSECKTQQNANRSKCWHCGKIFED